MIYRLVLQCLFVSFQSFFKHVIVLVFSPGKSHSVEQIIKPLQCINYYYIVIVTLEMVLKNLLCYIHILEHAPLSKRLVETCT